MEKYNDKESSHREPECEGEGKKPGFEGAPEGTLEGTSGGGGQDEAAELRTRLAYLMAEFDNFRKRAARDRETMEAYGNERLLQAILPFLDNLERAMCQEKTTVETLLAGVRMTYDTFLGELRKFGLEQISAEGSPFDPNLHEAVGVVPCGDKPEGTVIAETRKGYMLNGRLLRPAQVVVSSASSPDGSCGRGE